MENSTKLKLTILRMVMSKINDTPTINIDHWADSAIIEYEYI